MTITEKTVLFKGSKEKENIIILQDALKARGYYNYKVDGDFAHETDKSVRTFQKAQGLVVDGRAGPVTNKKLGILKSISISTSMYNSDKTIFLKQMAGAIGGRFNTLTECYNLIRKNETYKFGIGDTVAQKEAVENLQNGIGNNCVDYAQLLTAVAEDLNKVSNKGYTTRYVRTYCSKDKIGHVYIQIKGGEFGSSWVNVDGAAGASLGSKYNIGQAWCQNYPDKIYNQGYLKIDDGI